MKLLNLPVIISIIFLLFTPTVFARKQTNQEITAEDVPQYLGGESVFYSKPLEVSQGTTNIGPVDNSQMSITENNYLFEVVKLYSEDIDATKLSKYPPTGPIYDFFHNLGTDIPG